MKAFFRYLCGYLRIEISGYSPERFLNLCRNKQIAIWNLIPASHCYRLCISVKGFKSIKPIVRKTGTKISVLQKVGFPFLLNKYKHRSAFFIGFILCLCMIYTLSFFVWGIHIEGNQKNTDETILDFLTEKHVKIGMTKGKVNCERIVKDIRKEFDDIVWVSVWEKGSVIQVQIKESISSLKSTKDEIVPSDLFAQKNGKIIEIITRNGVPMVKAGEAVRKGQLLVSGQVEILNDAGEIVDIQYQHSDADIIAETIYEYYEELPFRYAKKMYTGKKRRVLGFRSKRSDFSIGFISNKFSQKDVFVSTKQCSLGKKLQLPIDRYSILMCEFKYKSDFYRKNEARDILSAKFEQYIKQMEEQEKILQDYDVKIYFEQEKAYAKGYVVVWENIGKQALINIDF